MLLLCFVIIAIVIIMFLSYEYELKFMHLAGTSCYIKTVQKFMPVSFIECILISRWMSCNYITFNFIQLFIYHQENVSLLKYDSDI